MTVQPRAGHASPSNQGDDCDLDEDVTTEPSQPSSGPYRCSADDDDSWMAPRDMTLLSALDSDAAIKPRASQRFRRLSKTVFPVCLVGEGAANAVFDIGPGFHGLLLRVAKLPRHGSSPTYDYLFQQTFYQTSIKPLLGGHVVQQELVVLRKSGIVNKLNKLLREIDSSRKPKFRGSFIGQSNWGFLVQDMRPKNPDECLLIEFKPKWLFQSPSAPPSAVRCRQCAMELRNLIGDPNRALPETKPCPLALANPDAPSSQASSPFRIAPHLEGIGADDHFRHALETIANHPALQQLKTQQRIHDALGPLHAEPSKAFLVAMTLRDCTCFVQIHHRQQSLLLRMGDFDWKDPSVKFKGWRQAEKDLIDGAFYTAELLLCGGSYYRPPTLCALEFAPRSPRQGAVQVLCIRDGKEGEAVTRGTEEATETGMDMFEHEADVVALRRVLSRYKIAPTEEPLSARRQFVRGSQEGD
ncbi:Inositol-pentakisphosphate 2-kinase [Ophiocordyceps camponoti-floridani]|uniref:Inositol-pentakisphosphate 2-kinase n=1 Tax=Ophiocordyceps camponoti-floridani TaxID=2030778 RepID=A0A8H4VB39_9HYPO|nr:Inositol-pentakisphosphate 2-kinase [Ophiocordyceps camponoti-floridani]